MIVHPISDTQSVLSSVSIRSGWLSLGLFSPCLSKLFYDFIALQSTSSSALLSSQVFLQRNVGRRWEKVNRHLIILSLRTLEGATAEFQVILNVVVNIGLFWATVSTVCILLSVSLRPLSTSECSLLKMWRGSLCIGHADEDSLDENALERQKITVIINLRIFIYNYSEQDSFMAANWLRRQHVKVMKKTDLSY